MPSLKCTKRDTSIKVKALRRSELAPAVIYGKNLKESVQIQVANIDFSKLVKEASLGSLVTVDVEGTTYETMLKKVDYVPMSKLVQHADFQVVTAGEKIKTSAPIHFINAGSVSSEGILQERLNALEYEVLPTNMVEYFEVDLAKLELGEDIKLQDLDVFADEKFNFITPDNASIVGLPVRTSTSDTTEETDEDAAAE